MSPEDHAVSAPGGIVMEAATGGSESPLQNETARAPEPTELPEAAEPLEIPVESAEISEMMTGMPEVGAIPRGQVSQGRQLLTAAQGKHVVDVGRRVGRGRGNGQVVRWLVGDLNGIVGAGHRRCTLAVIEEYGP